MATTNVDLRTIDTVQYTHNGSTTNITEVWFCCTNNATCCKIWPKRDPVRSCICFCICTPYQVPEVGNCSYSWARADDTLTTHHCGTYTTGVNWSADITYVRGQGSAASVTLTTNGVTCTPLKVCYSLICGCPPGKIVVRTTCLRYNPLCMYINIYNQSAYAKCCRCYGPTPTTLLEDFVLTEADTEYWKYIDVKEAGTYNYESRPIYWCPATATTSSATLCERTIVPSQIDCYFAEIDIYDETCTEIVCTHCIYQCCMGTKISYDA